jgi:predicted ABC-type transport system involved in lysophospholipase L1 biosynthesis ATPase subunit
MEPNNQAGVIIAEAVTKVYSDNGVPVEAVRGIDLTIKHGEFTAIVGPSGSGKTTFLNIVSGLDSVTSGRVWLAGRLLSEMSGRELSVSSTSCSCRVSPNPSDTSGSAGYWKNWAWPNSPTAFR